MKLQFWGLKIVLETLLFIEHKEHYQETSTCSCPHPNHGSSTWPKTLGFQNTRWSLARYSSIWFNWFDSLRCEATVQSHCRLLRIRCWPLVVLENGKGWKFIMLLSVHCTVLYSKDKFNTILDCGWVFRCLWEFSQKCQSKVLVWSYGHPLFSSWVSLMQMEPGFGVLMKTFPHSEFSSIQLLSPLYCDL